MRNDGPKPVAVKLDPLIRQRIGRLADVRQRSAHWMMREAITQYVEREEKREAFRQDALKAWQDYQETGLHVPAAAADVWLEKLENGEDAPLPEPVR
jgi:predicted transcriptional regulator